MEEWDLGEIYKAHKEFTKDKKLSNKESSTLLLDNYYVDYTSHNNGLHLIITTPKSTLIDFWPTTGKFIPRSTNNAQRGVLNLLNYIQTEK